MDGCGFEPWSGIGGRYRQPATAVESAIDREGANQQLLSRVLSKKSRLLPSSEGIFFFCVSSDFEGFCFAVVLSLSAGLLRAPRLGWVLGRRWRLFFFSSWMGRLSSFILVG